MPANSLPVNIVPGKTAPRYDTGVELEAERVTITEQGTVLDLPLVDLVMRHPDGTQCVVCLTGRMVNMIAAVVRGVNLRVHGQEEP